MRDDIRGAEATALFFLEQYAIMYQTGDTELWQSLSLDPCTYCGSALEGAQDLHADGKGVKGGEIVPRDSSVFAQMGPDGEVYVEMEATARDGYTVQPDGSEELTAPGTASDITMELHLVEGEWRVDGVNVESR